MLLYSGSIRRRKTVLDVEFDMRSNFLLVSEVEKTFAALGGAFLLVVRIFAVEYAVGNLRADAG